MPLRVAAFAFTVLWTGWMMWWSAPLHPASALILVLTGIAAGAAWYWLMRRLPPFRR